MWQDTALTRLLKIDVPIVQGPFGGGLSSHELTTAVSKAGGLGSFGANHLDPDQIRQLVSDLRKGTPRPFAVNLWIDHEDLGGQAISAEEFEARIDVFRPMLDALGLERPSRPARFGMKYEDQVAALLDAKPAVFSFVYGVPDAETLKACRARGIVTIGTATSVPEAVMLEEAGVDAIVATGLEAGGHRVSFLHSAEESLTGTFALVQLVRAAVRCPVIAAGGIAQGKAVAAALTLGADGVQVGTAFLATDESGASAPHRDILWSPEASHTRLTRAFTGRLARGVPNALSRMVDTSLLGAAPYPVQSWITGTLKAAAIAQGRADLMLLWAGQAAPLRRHRSAEAVFADLVAEASAAFGANGMHDHG